MIITLDLETTWLDKDTDKIIDIALIKFESKTFKELERYETLVNPGIEIPELISNITNIFNEDVKKSPKFYEISDKIEDFIWDLPILGHNVWFDIWFLNSYWINLSNNIVLDTFYLANFLSYSEKSLSLESLCLSYWIKLEWAHRAINDTVATYKLFKFFIKKIKNLSNEKLDFFLYIISKTNNLWYKFIVDNYLWNKKNILDKTKFLKILLKYFPEKKKYDNIIYNSNLEIDNIRQFMSNLDWLEVRENQKKMIDIVFDSLINNTKEVIEAPTWVWKTFAYLIPWILYSIKNWKQIYVSTSTKTLQDQIYYKDLEYLNKNLWLNFSYSKLKWKKNYLWLYTFLSFFSLEENFSLEKTTFLLKILFWILKTKTFELDELDYFWIEYSYLREINADDHITFSSKNLYELREPSVIARRQSRKTNITVINNNILFQDIDWDNNILWKLENVILDEAHNLEDIITSSLKKSFSINDLEKSFSIVDNILKKHKHSINNLDIKKEKIFFNIQLIFDVFNSYLQENINLQSSYKSILIKKNFFETNVDNVDILNLFASIKSDFLFYIDLLKFSPDEVYLDLNKEILLLEKYLEILEIILDKWNDNKYIKIISNSKNKWLILEYTLLNIWVFLEEKLWNKLDSCILTSATLKIWDNFSYIKKMLSINKFNFTSLDTDFNYDKQALVFIPNNLWNIKNNLSLVIDFLWLFISIVRWNTLVLFTSFYVIKEAYTRLSTDLKKDNINLYAQSIWGWKNKLLEFYKNNYKNSILFWTDTFWEWIDISWDMLKYLIIHKIPFMVPSDPIFQARSLLFDNAFMEYSIPKAIIKLKQWVWRLIRTKNDTGVIIFLDNRIYSTDWGKILYNAFPKGINLKIGTSEDLINVLRSKLK